MIAISELARVGGTPLRHSLVIGYVVLAFVGQAALGWGLMQGPASLKVVGGATVAWNLGLLTLFSLIIPEDMFIPLVHNVMSTVIAVALVYRMWSKRKEHMT